jgi:plastocyanin
MTTATVTVPRSFGWGTLSALGKTTLAALVGMFLAVSYIVVLVLGTFDPMGVIFLSLPLVAAAIILTGWRWAPLLGTLVGGLLLAAIGPGLPFMASQPDSPMFPPFLIIVGLSVVAVVAGIAATTQNYRRSPAERHMPRGLPYALVALASLLGGAVAMGAVPRPGIEGGIDPAALTGAPTLAAQDFAFAQAEIRVKANETVTLRLDNADPELHFFDLDEFNIHAPMPVGKTGVAIFRPTQPGEYTFYCAPHANKATGEGMVGTLIVEP